MRALVLLGLWLSPSTYDEACVALDAGITTVQSGDPEDAVAQLTSALEGITHFPAELATDDKTLKQRDLALLALAFSYAALEDEQGAIAAMDEAIRIARGRELPVQLFSPNISQLHARRVAALSALGKSTIVVSCSDCTVLINESPSETTSEALFPGIYRVWVLADGEASTQIVELDGTAQRVDVAVSLPVPAPTMTPPAEQPPPAAPGPNGRQMDTRQDDLQDVESRGRKLPRWASITGTAVGAAAAIVGGVILSFDGRCPGGLDPVTDRPECPEVFDAKPAGISVLAGGAAMLTGFGVALTVDEIQGQRARSREVAVRYTFRF